MPTAPTIHSIGGTGSSGGVAIEYQNSGVGDHNELWRAAASEYGGAFIKIGDSLPWVTSGYGNLIDYSVGSGVLYSYQMVAVDSGGGTAASSVAQATPVLASASLHSVISMVGSLTSNAMDISLIVDMIPHTRQYRLGIAQYRHMGMFADVPVLKVSSIEENQVGLLIRLPVKNSAEYLTESSIRQYLRSMTLSRRYVCLRDTRGNKFFGLMSYSEIYAMPTFSDLTMQFYVCDFNEEIG